MTLRKPIVEEYFTKKGREGAVRELAYDKKLKEIAEIKEITGSYGNRAWKGQALSNNDYLRIELSQHMGDCFEGLTGGSVKLSYFQGTDEEDIKTLRGIIEKSGLERKACS